MKIRSLLLSTILLLLFLAIPVFAESVEIERIDFKGISRSLKEGDSGIAWKDYDSTPIYINGQTKVRQGDIYDKNITWTLAWVKLAYDEATDTYSLASPSYNNDGDQNGDDWRVYWDPIEADTYYGLYVQCIFDYGEGGGYGAGSIFSLPGPDLLLYVNGENYSSKIKRIKSGFDGWNDEKDSGRYWEYRGFYVITKSASGEEDPGEHTVTITAGSNMTKTTDSGAELQTGLTGAMTDVVYTANEGYYFPENYSVTAVNGISVTRNSYTQITVSGTPIADAAITLTAPTAKTTPDAPTTAAATDCTTAENNDGKLTGVTAEMEYKKSDATSWTVGTGNDIIGLVPGIYYVRVKATDTTTASGNQELTITAYQKENAVITKAPTAKSVIYNGSAQELVTMGEATGGEMQYAFGTATEATKPYTTSIPTATDAGTYYVWYKVVGDGDHLDTEPKCITVTISPKEEPQTEPQPQPQPKPTEGNSPSVADTQPSAEPLQIQPSLESQTTTSPAIVKEPITIEKTPASVKAKVKKNKATVTWKKIKKTKKTKALLAQIKGIEVQYSADPSFPSATSVKVPLGKKKTKLVLKGLPSKTAYYVRVRYTDGAGGYSNWSKVKAFRTK